MMDHLPHLLQQQLRAVPQAAVLAAAPAAQAVAAAVVAVQM